MDGMNSEMKSGGGMYPEFSAPEGLELEGDTGEAMVTWKRKPDGQICITTFDGISLGTDDGMESESGPESYETDLKNLATESEAA